LTKSTQVLHLLCKVARGGTNEGNPVYGREVRQEEHDLLPALRTKENEPPQGEVQLMRLRKKRKAKKVQLAEEDKVKDS